MSYILKIGREGSKRFSSLSNARKYARGMNMKRIFIAKPTRGGFKVFRN